MPYQGRIPAGADVNELMQHVDRPDTVVTAETARPEPEKAKDLGPYETLGLKLTLEGRFTEIDEFLKWVETDQRLLRIDTIKLDPDNKDPARLEAQVILLSLVEKPAANLRKPSPEAGKKTMTTAKLINLAPMLIMVTFLAYAGYSIHASAGDPAAGESGLRRTWTPCCKT